MENPAKCACGCGENVKPRKEKWRPKSRFLLGHQPTLKPPEGMVFTGLCQCGCGQKTRIATQGKADRGEYAGYPVAYIRNHSKRGKPGRNPRRANGPINEHGYLKTYMPGHHLANGAGYVMEHRRIWEEANGRRLRDNEQVHHIDGNKRNNAPENLVALTNADHQREHGPTRGERLKKWKRDHPEEFRKRLSEGTKRAWATGKKAINEATKAKISESHRKRWTPEARAAASIAAKKRRLERQSKES